MLYTPQKGRRRCETNLGANGDDTIGTAVTTGGSTNAKGTVAQLIASTSFDAYMVHVAAGQYAASATDSSLLVDILVGASTEEVLIADLMFGECGFERFFTRSYIFPLYVPAGTRIAAQAAGDRTSTTFRLGIALYGGDGIPPFRMGRKVTTYGIGTVPNGTTITPGTSGGAGTFTQITASTSEDHFAFMPGFQVGTDTTKTAAGYMAAIGTGASTEETIGVWGFSVNGGEECSGPFPEAPAFADVPAGTRLAMRFSNSAGANDSGNYNGAIYAVS